MTHKNDKLNKKNLIFTNFPSRLDRINNLKIPPSGILQIDPEQNFQFTVDDLVDEGEIGKGAYGTVNRFTHKQSGRVMAVKRIRSTVDENGQKKLLDLDVVMRSSDCSYIVQFYGALFKEGDCWICMELMSISLDKFYKFIHHKLLEMIPEAVLGKLTVSMVKALLYLKEKLKIIHRDVKPSNILLNHNGEIKLCDFGISGELVDSIARTQDAGCRPYMAPERIDPEQSIRGYSVKSDIWSLGITLFEVATGVYPYPCWNTPFEQLQHVLESPPPLLAENDQRFSREFIFFINRCLIKDHNERPNYHDLMKDAFIQRYDGKTDTVSAYIGRILDLIPSTP